MVNRMTVDEAYMALSARITAEVVQRQTDNWPVYFSGLRNVTHRVVADTVESGLAAEEKAVLVQRLLDHIAELEKWWPSFSNRGQLF
jgi:hypothetical protein